MPVALVAGHPAGGILINSPSGGSGDSAALIWLRDVESKTSVSEPFAAQLSPSVLQLAADRSSVVLLDYLLKSVEVLDSEGGSSFKFSGRAFFAIHALAVADKRVFGVGVPLIAAAPITGQNLSDPNWRRQHERQDCRLFMTDLGRDHLAVDPLFCSSSLGQAMEPFWGGGQLMASLNEDRVYAVLNRHPALLVFDRQGKRIAETPYLIDGEKWLPPESVLPMGGARQDWRAVLNSLEGIDFPSALIDGPDGVGVIFRRSLAGSVSFVADIFDSEGHKLSNDVSLNLGAIAENAVLRSFRVADGRQYLLLQRLQSFAEIESQHLYRVEWLDRSTEPRMAAN